jgi:hypothetical protein
MAAAAFNRGLQGLKNAVTAQKNKQYFDLYLNTETSRYVARIIAVKLILEEPQLYGFHLKEHDYYPQRATYEVQVDTTIDDLAGWAIKFESNYKTLRELNPWLQGYSLKVTDKKYVLKLPSMLSEGFEENKR